MTAAVVKVVFDTNIFVSGHFWKGPPYRCLLAAEARLATLVVSEPILSELREKLIDKFGIPEAEVAAIVNRLGAYVETVPVLGRTGWVAQDADDDKFIDAAYQEERPSSFPATGTFSHSGRSRRLRFSRPGSSSIAWRARPFDRSRRGEGACVRSSSSLTQQQSFGSGVRTI